MRFGLLALALAFAALLGWVASPGPSFLDLLVALGLAAGAALAAQGYRRGQSQVARRLAVVALGVNAAALLLLVLLYLAG
jgi:hypothetical protein